jgi:hypothetical protein
MHQAEWLRDTNAEAAMQVCREPQHPISIITQEAGGALEAFHKVLCA